MQYCFNLLKVSNMAIRQRSETTCRDHWAMITNEHFIDLFESCLVCEVTNPRDMVYGMIGVLRIGIDADYTEKVVTVYYHFAQWFHSTFVTMDFKRIGLAFNPSSAFGLTS